VLLGGQKLAPASIVADTFKIIFKWMGIFVIGTFILSFFYNISAEPTLMTNEKLAISFFRGIAALGGGGAAILLGALAGGVCVGYAVGYISHKVGSWLGSLIDSLHE